MDRSSIMRAVRSHDTRPEILVRRLAHSLGFRFRLHRADLPGKPDLVFPQRRKIIFVHGCFWHGHGCKRGARVPKTNVPYWTAKIARNRRRDVRHLIQLRSAGWSVAVIWECQTKDSGKLAKRLLSFLRKVDLMPARQ